jgi:preprotein translocase subunit SecD
MKRIVLLLSTFVLFASMLACSLSTLSGPRLSITLAPATEAVQDAASLLSAREVILRRLKSMGLTNVSITASSNGTLLVSLPASANLESVTPLLTETGLITFVDSLVPVVEGTPFTGDGDIILTGADLENAQVTTGSPGFFISITFTPRGAQIMADYSSNNIGHYLIIVRDGTVISSPVIDMAITGGEAVIQGNFTQETAAILFAQLTGGALPFPLLIVETTTK